MKKTKIAAITLGLAACCSQGFAAQALDDPSGRAQELAAIPAAQSVENQVPAATAGQQEIRFHVARLVVDSEVPVPAKVVRRAVKEFEDKDIVFADLNRAVNVLTEYARSHGNPAAAAYVPAQSSSDGVLQIKVTAGRIGKVILDDQSRLRESAVTTAAARLKAGSIITTKDLETVLYTLNGLGGVQAVGVLSPGEAFGTSDVTIRVRPGKDTSVMLYTENYGSKAAGRYRLGMVYDRAQMNGTGDSLQITGLLSDESMRNYSIRYQTLAGHTGSVVGLSVSRMTYDLGENFANLDATGKATTYSAFGRTPFYTTTNGGLALTYGVDHRRLEDHIGQFDYQNDKIAWNMHLGLDGYRRIGKSSWSYDITGYNGNLALETGTAELMNEAADTKGRFVKGVANLKYQQGFNRQWDMITKIQVQRASRNLDSSEQMYLGGVSGVRAYPQGSGSGDQGWLGSVELRYHTAIPYLTLSTYLDSGQVDARKDGRYGDVGYTMQGWGLGMTYARPADYFLRLDYARRIGFDEDLKDSSANARDRFWFMAGKMW